MPAASVTRNVPGTMIFALACDATATAAVMKIVLRAAPIVPMINPE
jgi:hypothetical protein